MILAKECISKVRDEAVEQSQRELANEISREKKRAQVALKNASNY